MESKLLKGNSGEQTALLDAEKKTVHLKFHSNPMNFRQQKAFFYFPMCPLIRVSTVNRRLIFPFASNNNWQTEGMLLIVLNHESVLFF